MICFFFVFRGKTQKLTKFLGQSIKHEWVVDEVSKQRKWYEGFVVSILSGSDGDRNAVYEVQYEDDEEAYEIDHLVQDYELGSVKFSYE